MPVKPIPIKASDTDKLNGTLIPKMLRRKELAANKVPNISQNITTSINFKLLIINLNLSLFTAKNLAAAIPRQNSKIRTIPIFNGHKELIFPFNLRLK